MKKFCFALTLTAIFLGSSQIAFSCTIYIPPFRKVYRESKSVFVGKVLKIEEYYNLTETDKRIIPEHWLQINDRLRAASQYKGLFSKITFEIKDKWKGNIAERKDFISVSAYDCGCPGDGINVFEIAQEYLVTAREKNFVSVCDSKTADSDWAKDDIKRLDKFWFRTWATIYPF